MECCNYNLLKVFIPLLTVESISRIKISYVIVSAGRLLEEQAFFHKNNPIVLKKKERNAKNAFLKILERNGEERNRYLKRPFKIRNVFLL